MDYGGSLQAAKEFAALDKNIQLGRLTMWGFVFDWLGSVDWITKLFGLGYGSVTPSVWLHSSDDLLLRSWVFAVGFRAQITLCWRSA